MTTTSDDATRRRLPGPPAMRLRALRFNLHLLIPPGILILAAGVQWAGWPAMMAGAAATVLVLLMTDAIARPASGLFYPTVTHGPRGSRCVALSFDDGPDASVTPQVLDSLRSHGARATFFVIGRSLEAHPDLARRIVTEGHALGNHSWQHARTQNFRFRKWQRKEIDHCERAIAHVADNARRGLYRPPMGLKFCELCRELWRRQLTLVAWSLHSHDTRLTDPQKIARRVLGRVRSGDVILLHDGHDLPGRHRPYCAQAVELILQGLRQKGLSCVTIPELLHGGRET